MTGHLGTKASLRAEVKLNKNTYEKAVARNLGVHLFSPNVAMITGVFSAVVAATVVCRSGYLKLVASVWLGIMPKVSHLARKVPPSRLIISTNSSRKALASDG